MTAAHQLDMFAPPIPAKAPTNHREAMTRPQPGFERGVVTLFRGLAEYADAHRKQYGSIIMDDGVIGEYWHWLGEALIGLLNGDTGRLDCGTLDGQIRDLIERGGTEEAVREARALTAVEQPTPTPQPARSRSKKPAVTEIKIGQRALSDRQRELLGHLKVENNVAVYQPDGFIDDWAELKAIMTALGGSWKTGGKKSKGGFRFADDVDAQEAVRLALETGEILDPKQAEFFPTPRVLAELLVERAEIGPGMSVLEPSAGEGGIALVVRERHPDADIQCVEALQPHVEKLRALRFKVEPGNFLHLNGANQFERIVANPPFSRQQDIEHVTWAFNDHLKSGGILVSIMSGGVRYRDDRKSREFRALVEQNGGQFWDNEDGSFIESGTNCRTCMVKMVKR